MMQAAAWTQTAPLGSQVEISDAPVHSGRQVPAVVQRPGLTAGRLTMQGITPERSRSAKPCLVALDGETLPSPRRPAPGVPTGGFQTSRRPALQAVDGRAHAGAPHHGARCPGYPAKAARWLAGLAGPPVTINAEHGTHQ